MLAPARFRFLNDEHVLQGPADWNNPAWDRLWLYNLHYFDDLEALDPQGGGGWARLLIDRWVRENPPVAGVGWEPYCLSLRIVNWVRAHWSGESLGAEARASLAVQLRALARQLEFRLLGNHLWANAKALAFGALFFQGREADHWLAAAGKHLGAQLDEQVLGDGGHFERSPMYHNIIAADVLDLIEADRVRPNRLPDDLVAALKRAAPLLLSWGEAMSHDDGQPSFFNDSCMAIAPPASILRRRAEQLGLAPPPEQRPLRVLQPSGYVRAQAGPALVIADIGPIGPDYLPGHAHADTLSFELSIGGRRLLVNSGISTYEAGPRRLWERGTAAHNTVAVDEQDSSEVWHSFRVARRARAIDLAAADNGRNITIEAAHDGYLRLPGRVLHRRRWLLTDEHLEVLDVLEGQPKQASAYWHFHPDVTLEADGATGFICRMGGEAALSVTFTGGTPTLTQGKWSPQFGLLAPNSGVHVTFDGDRLISSWTWTG